MYEVQHIKKAIQSTKIGELTPNERKNVVKGAMAKCYADLLYKFEEKELEYTFNELLKLVEFKYYYLGKDEIMIAFRNGITKKYGEFFGLSFATFEFFLVNYCESRRDIKKAIVEPSRLLEAPVKEINYDEFGEFLLNTYKTKGQCLDYGNVYYNHLIESGKVVLTIDDKQEYYDIAYSQIEAENSRKATTLEELRISQRILEDLEKGTLEEKVKSRAKRLVVIDYFNKLLNTK